MGHKTARKGKQVRLQTHAADTCVKVDPPRRYNAQLRNESEPLAKWHTHKRRPPTRGLRKITKNSTFTRVFAATETPKRDQETNQRLPNETSRGFSSYLKRQVIESVAA